MSHNSLPRPSNDNDTAIATRAYALWEAEGRPDGRALAHWVEAEREIAVGRFHSDGSDNGSSAADALQLHEGPGISNLDRALPPEERQRARRARDQPETPPRAPTTSDARVGHAAHFIIALDRAHLRIYRTDQATDRTADQPWLEESIDLPAGKENYTSRESDQAGRFAAPRGGPAGGSIDERLPMQQEHDRRLAVDLAAQVESFLGQHPTATWDFAAGPALHHAVLDQLSPRVRARLDVALRKDLVNQPVDTWRERFENPTEV